MDHWRVKRVSVGERLSFWRRDNEGCRRNRDRRERVRRALTGEDRRERSDTVMVSVIERARVLDGIRNQVTVDERWSGFSLMQVGGR